MNPCRISRKSTSRQKISWLDPRAAAFAVACAFLLAGCTVGPKYSKPTVPAAPAYAEAPPASFGESQGWKTAQPSDSSLRGAWWEVFGDTDLNALEEQVAQANQTLKIAEANFRDARAQS